MTVLITGGKGFIGSTIARQLVEQGERPLCLDIRGTPGRLADIIERVELIDGGIPGVDALRRLLESRRVDQLVHSVFFMSAPGSAEEVHQEMEIMVKQTVDLFEAARLAGVRRVIFPSSIHYYGPQWLHGEVPLGEDRPGLAMDIYGVAKKLGEVTAHFYNMRVPGMRIISLRVPAVYGIGGRYGARGVNVAAYNCALGDAAQLPFAADDHVCLGDVQDVARAMITLLQAPSPAHEVYNAGGHTRSYGELAALVQRFLPDAQITFDETTGRTDLPYRIDSSRIRDEFGFEHRPLEAGYRALIDHTRAQAGLPPL